MNNSKKIEQITATWGLDLLRMHDDLEIAGSPERSLERMVIEDQNKNRYVLEKISGQNLPRKQKIAENLTFIKNRGISLIHPA